MFDITIFCLNTDGMFDLCDSSFSNQFPLYADKNVYHVGS